jgi:hypothetical protein
LLLMACFWHFFAVFVPVFEFLLTFGER